MERTTAGSDSGRQRRSGRREPGDGSSGGAGRGSVAALHDAVGNQAVQEETDENDRSRATPDGGVVQPKLEVSQPGDPAEREAERVAEAVVGSDEPGGRVATLDRRATRCGPTTRNERGAVDDETEARIRSLTRGGSPLDESVRSDFEARFGRGFSDVRIHDGPAADRAARSIGAEAFTHGTDIVFRRRQYDPDSRSGRRLIAHELAHVVQQGGGGQVQRAVAGNANTQYNEVGVYTVERGDTLSGIAERAREDYEEFDGTYHDLWRHNEEELRGDNPNEIYPDETVRVPGVSAPGAGPGGKTGATQPTTGGQSGPTRSMTPAPSGGIDRALLAEAVDVFAASRASESPFGSRVEDKLEQLLANDELAVEDLPGDVGAQSREHPKPGQAAVAVDEGMEEDVVVLSTSLVHEAVHLLYDGKYIDEELKTRNVSLDLYEDLLQGVIVNGTLYITTKELSRGGRTVWKYHGLEYQRRMRDMDMLVDAILELDEYVEQPGFMDAAWVENHLHDWGGLSNRTARTKALYLFELMHDPAPHTDAFISILETFDTEVGLNMLFFDVDLGGVEALREYIEDEGMLTSPGNYNRLSRIEERTGVDLGVEPEKSDPWSLF